MKHTQEWEYWSDKDSVGGIGGYFVAPKGELPTLAHVYNYPGKTETHARLIAAAPKLFEVCETIVKNCEAGFKELGMEGPDRKRMGLIWFRAYQMCKEVIEIIK